MSARWFRKLLVTLGNAAGTAIDSSTQEVTRSELSTGDEPFFEAQTDGVLSVPSGGVSTPVPLGGVTAGKAVTLMYDEAVSLSIDGGAAIQLSVPSTGDGVFHLEGAFATLALVNNGADDATVRYLVVGT